GGGRACGGLRPHHRRPPLSVGVRLQRPFGDMRIDDANDNQPPGGAFQEAPFRSIRLHALGIFMFLVLFGLGDAIFRPSETGPSNSSMLICILAAWTLAVRLAFRSGPRLFFPPRLTLGMFFIPVMLCSFVIYGATYYLGVLIFHGISTKIL